MTDDGGGQAVEADHAQDDGDDADNAGEDRQHARPARLLLQPGGDTRDPDIGLQIDRPQPLARLIDTGRAGRHPDQELCKPFVGGVEWLVDGERVALV